MRLPLDEIQVLLIAHKKARTKIEADKIKCIIYWGKGYSWENIKEILFISDGSIKNYLDAYQKGGIELLLSTNYHGNNHKLSIEEENILCNYIDKHNVLRSLQAVKYVKNRFKKKFSINGMTKTLKRLGFSYKKPKRIPCKTDSISEGCFIMNYQLRSLNLNENENLYFMDASGFEYNSKIDYGWIRKGKNKSIKTTSGRKKLNINGAYNPKAHELISIIQEENVNTDSNIALLEKILSLNEGKQKVTVFLDNAKMNKNQRIFDFVKKNNEYGTKLELFYIPVYSPHLNLIERLWKYIKKKVLSNRYYSTYDKFKRALQEFTDKRLNKLEVELAKLITENFQRFNTLDQLQI